MDQTRSNARQARAPQSATPAEVFGQGNSPTLERGVPNGGKLHVSRRQQRARLSQSESQGSGAEEEWVGVSTEAAGSYGQIPIQAESSYHRGLAGSSSAPLSSSPRSPGTRRSFTSSTLTFHSKRPYVPQQQDNPDHGIPTVKSSGTPRRQSSRGRNRTSSETEQQRGKGSRGPSHRKRGLSETESRPRWDNTKMSGLQCLATENIWFDKHSYDEAEKRFYEGANGPSTKSQEGEPSAILQDIAKSRQTIQHSLDSVKTALQPAAKGRHQKRQHRNSSSHAGGDQELITRMKSLELENQSLHRVVEDMRAVLQKLESRVAVLEKNPAAVSTPCARAAPVQQVNVENGGGDDDEDDDDIDLFGSDDEEDAEAARLKQERLDAYAAKKAKKPALIAKSSILLDVKPWDDETDMAKLEECVRSVQADGLLWGASKLLPVGYGIKKLQINCVVEDDKVGTDLLEEEITKFEDYVQSVDVAAFNKI